MTVFVINKYGERLMPTTRLGRVRHLLKDGKAIIYKHKPFTIQLTCEAANKTQPIELCVDTGAVHIGVSMKSEVKEYIGNQYDLLIDEKQRHDDCRQYRRTRRNRLRYRKARFDNRRRKEGWLAPSLQNKADQHIAIINDFCSVAPITSVTLEMGQFDIQLMKAINEGKPIPEGADYQHGPKYQIETLREACFMRDNHTCQFCGRTIKDKAILHAHHAYYWRGQHGNSLDELVTTCEKCHTPKNHQKGGMLWGFDKKLKRYNSAAFMNTVKWCIYNKIRETNQNIDVKITYGAMTKIKRSDFGIEKSHINDAYSMGDFHPQIRCKQQYFKKIIYHFTSCTPVSRH